MANSLGRGFIKNFLGTAPDWYKLTILAFLVLNPVVLFVFGPVVTGWLLVFEFIFTLAMALKCYPLLPGGLLAIEAVLLGMTSTATVFHELELGFEVILLLIFMVAGIYFLKDLLLFTFTKILLRIRNKTALAIMFSFMGAIMSAFLDALTVTAVVIAVSVGFYSVYHRAASGKGAGGGHGDDGHGGIDLDDDGIPDLHRGDLEQFRAFLRSLVMHAVVGTALGGVMTIVGEPQNLLIGTRANWSFVEFFLRMAPVTLPVFVVGILTCIFLEKTGMFGYGAKLPDAVRKILEDFDRTETAKRTTQDKAALVAQTVIAVWLVIGLLFHLAAVGIIGLSVIVLATSFSGVNDEHRIGRAFTEALPFTALLGVFFVIVGVINDQHLFTPVIKQVIDLDPSVQATAFYLANGILSAISDNVFVATVYINQAKDALLAGAITRDQFDVLAVAINTGTNIPSVATPNGQAAFLFLLTSALAPLIRLSYGRMVLMALPYTIMMTLTGLLAVIYLLNPVTDMLYEKQMISHHSVKEILDVPTETAKQH